jgi:Universal stress protein family
MTIGRAISGRRGRRRHDGSPASSAALERAVDAAGDDGVVFVVHAYQRPRGEFGAAHDQARLDSVLAVAAARHAHEIVVGSRRFGLARALLGSVAQDLIRIADVPVTVIPRGVAPRADAA